MHRDLHAEAHHSDQCKETMKLLEEKKLLQAHISSLQFQLLRAEKRKMAELDTRMRSIITKERKCYEEKLRGAASASTEIIDAKSTSSAYKER